MPVAALMNFPNEVRKRCRRRSWHRLQNFCLSRQGPSSCKITLRLNVDSSSEVVGAYTMIVSSWDKSSDLSKKVMNLLVFHEVLIGSTSNAGLILAKDNKEEW